MKNHNHASPIPQCMRDFVRSWHRNERGTVAFSIPVGLFFFMVFAGLLFNTGATINGKIETQNAADAAVYSGSVSIARGLNAMTASNHLIGELNALYVVHHSLGGTWLDRKPNQENKNGKIVDIQNGMKLAYDSAKGLSDSTPADLPLQPALYNRVKGFPKADINSTIYEAKDQLKKIMIGAYLAHFAGAGMVIAGQTPLTAYLVPAGLLVQAASLLTQLAVVKEYLVLDGLELLAVGVLPFKKIIPGAIVAAHVYQKALKVGASALAAEASVRIAEHNGAVPIPDNFLESAVTLLAPPFPVEREKTTRINRSQLMRATYPWVAFWSNNIASRLRRPVHPISAPLSGAGGYFIEWSNKYAYQSTQLLRAKKNPKLKMQLTQSNHGDRSVSGSGENGSDIKLYVLKGLNETGNGAGWHKSREVWNDWENRRKASSEIESLFCYIGLVRSKAAPRLGVRRFFRQENPGGFLCYAQSMVYNANPQQKPADSGDDGSPQPTTGWDTLNWEENAIEYKGRLTRRPKIKLNWQAKLTPVTAEKMLKKSYILLDTTGLIIDAQSRNTLTTSREGLLFLNNH